MQHELSYCQRVARSSWSGRMMMCAINFIGRHTAYTPREREGRKEERKRKKERKII